MKYRVVAEITISVSVIVSAKSKAEARKLAAAAPLQSFCWQCSEGNDDEWSISGELDGEPKIIEVRES